MKKIAWEKIDIEPEINLEDVEYPIESSEDDEPEGFLPFSYEILNPETPKVKTPFGSYAFDDQFSPYKMFDCWICHTNFPITPFEYLIIDDYVEGIGAFKVLSKYRFCIGIEKLFSITQVREDVHKYLCGDDDVTKEARKIDSVMSKISTHDEWAVFIGDDGDVSSSSIEIDGDSHKQNLSYMKKKKGGKLIVCEKR